MDQKHALKGGAEDSMEHLRRYQFSWRVIRFLLKPVRCQFNYDPEICREKGTLLVVCNHNTDWDPILLGLGFPSYMSFVASEHIFRWGFAGKLITALMAPISRLKGRNAADTVMTVLRRLRQGVSVAMFAEGNRSFNGLTGEILPATGKLARSSGATLVTYRLDGGYFTSPRWCASRLRRGKMTGRVVHVYKPEELKAMTADQVNAAIRRDLFVDAYDVQRRKMIPYRGKALAEHLETVLCRCPRCGRLDTLHSRGEILCCDCGFSVRYTEYGFLEGEDAPFDNITDWDRDQTDALCALADSSQGPIFSDDGMVLREIHPDSHTAEEVGRGEMTLYADRLTCCGMVFPLSELEGFSLHGPQTVDLTWNRRSFEISSPEIRCTRKYMTVIRYLEQKGKK